MLITTGHIRDLHLVAVHRRHGVALSHKDGGSTVIRQERVTTIGLASEGAFLHLRLHIQTVGVITDFTQEIIPCHLLHRVDGEHLQRMGIELQRLENLLERKRLENLLERKRLIRIVLEEILKQFADLLLAQSFSTFLLSHRV